MAKKKTYKQSGTSGKNFFQRLPKWAKITVLSVAGAVVVGGVVWGGIAIDKAITLNKQSKCQHEYSEGVVTREAICDVDGVLSFTCSKCDKVKTESIPMLGHKTEVVKGYAATCTTDGKTDGTVCSVCEKTVTEQSVIPKLGHNIVVDKGEKATCLKSGLTEGQHCKRCEEVLIKQEKIPALKHKPVTVKGYAATCEEDGLTDGSKCEYCGEPYSEQTVIDALGHNPITHAGKAATCLEKGWNTYETCGREGCTYTTYEEISPLGHTYVNGICSICNYELSENHTHAYTMEEITQATCEEDGVKIRKCICGDTQTETLTAKGHAWNLGETIDPVCEKEGKKIYICANGCGDTKEESIAALEHDYREELIQEISCTQDRIVKYTCARPDCGNWYTVTTEANGHRYDEGTVTVTVSCLNDGEITYYCMDCGEPKKETIAKLAHTKEVLAYVAPTCTTSGWTAGEKCSVCGTVTVAQTEIAANEHKFGAWQTVSELSCETDGVKERTCTVAGCGKTETQRVTATGHNWDEGEVTIEATCGSAGVKIYTCTNDGCGKTKTELIPKKEVHWFVGGICQECGKQQTGDDIGMIN